MRMLLWILSRLILGTLLRPGRPITWPRRPSGRLAEPGRITDGPLLSHRCAPLLPLVLLLTCGRGLRGRILPLPTLRCPPDMWPAIPGRSLRCCVVAARRLAGGSRAALPWCLVANCLPHGAGRALRSVAAGGIAGWPGFALPRRVDAAGYLPRSRRAALPWSLISSNCLLGGLGSTLPWHLVASGCLACWRGSALPWRVIDAGGLSGEAGAALPWCLVTARCLACRRGSALPWPLVAAGCAPYGPGVRQCLVSGRCVPRGRRSTLPRCRVARCLACGPALR